MKITLECKGCEGAGKITRECCEEVDRKVLTESKGMRMFCTHCGQRFYKATFTDAAGGVDFEWEKELGETK